MNEVTYSVQDYRDKLKVFDDENFVFYPEDHKYFYKEQELTSVSEFYERFIKPFDSDFWSYRKAKERWADRYAEQLGIDVKKLHNQDYASNVQSILEVKEEILLEWEKKAELGCALGSDIHEWIEDFLNGKNPTMPVEQDRKDRVYKFLEIYYEKLSKLQNVVQEIKIFSPRLKIAGTIDGLFYFKGNLIIGDWKTNKKFKTDDDKCYGKLLPPFNTEKDNELNKYSLQLSLYRLILEEYGIFTKYPFLCHIGPEGPAAIYQAKDYRNILRKYFISSGII